MYVLGISCYYHDAAAALIHDGQLVAAAEEERFTRRKHDADFPQHAIDFCLRRAGIASADLDYVVFYENPFLKFERILMSTLHTFPRSVSVFRESMVTWLLDKLWVAGTIRQRLGLPSRDRVLFSEHHLSHAAAAFLCSPFDEAAILTVDGVGEWATASYGHGQGTEIHLDRELRFPHSLGMLYSAFTAFLGFEVNEGEYKVMGMAPYGEPRYVDKVMRLLRLQDDGSFWLDMDYFAFHRSRTEAFSPKFLQLFGAPRDPRGADSAAEPYYADVAASIQVVTEEILVRMANHLYQQTGSPNLCLAGGVALNSVANWKLLQRTPFEHIFVQPAAGDSGSALGAALWVYHAVTGRPRGFVLEHAAWGDEPAEAQIADFLRIEGIPHVQLAEDALLDRTVETLQQGQVVGWLNGRFEWGPRALGHRSILADPRRAEMKDVVNAKIKFREPFRPFAPSVLAERVADHFDIGAHADSYPARYMLYVVPVRDCSRDRIPATTHVDGTGRLQVVRSDTNPRYYRLIQRWEEASGVPVVLNTSFNLRGEPIVNTPAEAFSTFMRSEMDALVLGDYLVDKRQLD